MTYKLMIEHKPAYLHAIATGEHTKENVMLYLEDVARECAARDCWSVLIEERLEGERLDLMSVFEIASQGAARNVGKFSAIAYVDIHADADAMKFAETVAVDRGMPVRVFATVFDAEKWLLSKSKKVVGPRAPDGD